MQPVNDALQFWMIVLGPPLCHPTAVAGVQAAGKILVVQAGKVTSEVSRAMKDLGGMSDSYKGRLTYCCVVLATQPQMLTHYLCRLRTAGPGLSPLSHNG